MSTSNTWAYLSRDIYLGDRDSTLKTVDWLFISSDAVHYATIRHGRDCGGLAYLHTLRWAYLCGRPAWRCTRCEQAVPEEIKTIVFFLFLEENLHANVGAR
jgi:hypothetical protein